MLKLNGVAVAAPTTFKVDVEDLDGESERNARGNLVRDRLAVKRKLECEWGVLTESETSRILKAVQGVFFPVEYHDPVEGKKITKTFYVGGRSAPMLTMKGSTPMWQGLTMNLIEQ